MFCKSNIYKTIFSYKFPSFFRSSAVSLRGQGGSLGGMPYNARRLCEVFCILQNLQMYEVPERASDGKASGRCDGSPKGFRHIGPRIYVVAKRKATNLT